MSTPEKTAERMREVARRILASERPSASRVATALREILAEVEGAHVPDDGIKSGSPRPRSRPAPPGRG